MHGNAGTSRSPSRICMHRHCGARSAFACPRLRLLDFQTPSSIIYRPRASGAVQEAAIALLRIKSLAERLDNAVPDVTCNIEPLRAPRYTGMGLRLWDYLTRLLQACHLYTPGPYKYEERFKERRFTMWLIRAWCTVWIGMAAFGGFRWVRGELLHDKANTVQELAIHSALGIFTTCSRQQEYCESHLTLRLHIARCYWRQYG